MIKSNLPGRLHDSTAFLLTQAIKRGSRLAQPKFGGERLRFAHYVTLAFLAETRVSSQRELSTALGTDPSDLVTVLDELIDAGFAVRTVDTADRRRRTVAVTPAGEDWLRERDRAAADYDRQLCASLPDGGGELRRQLRSLLGD